MRLPSSPSSRNTLVLSIEETRAKIKRLDAIQRLLAKARASARQRGHEFNLDVNDIEIPERCPYLNVAFKGTDYQPSIDRINSGMGYVRGNVEVVSLRYNLLKNNATRSELVTMAINILRKYEPHRLAAGYENLNLCRKTSS